MQKGSKKKQAGREPGQKKTKTFFNVFHIEPAANFQP